MFDLFQYFPTLTDEAWSSITAQAQDRFFDYVKMQTG